MPFWLPKGTHVWNELTKLWRTSNVERGYTEVRTPILYDVELWKKSGHWHVTATTCTSRTWRASPWA